MPQYGPHTASMTKQNTGSCMSAQNAKHLRKAYRLRKRTQVELYPARQNHLHIWLRGHPVKRHCLEATAGVEPAEQTLPLQTPQDAAAKIPPPALRNSNRLPAETLVIVYVSAKTCTGIAESTLKHCFSCAFSGQLTGPLLLSTKNQDSVSRCPTRRYT